MLVRHVAPCGGASGAVRVGVAGGRRCSEGSGGRAPPAESARTPEIAPRESWLRSAFLQPAGVPGSERLTPPAVGPLGSDLNPQSSGFLFTSFIFSSGEN